MSNTLTALQPLLFSAARVVPRELTGVVAAANRDFNDKGCAKGDTVTIGISPVASVSSHTASQTFTAGTDRTPTSAVMTLGQEGKSSWNLTPEQELSLGNGGTADDILKQTVQQHIRAHVNAIEAYAWGVARKNASRSYGTPTTDPFGTDQKPLAPVLKNLIDNGAGTVDLNAIISTTSGSSLRQVSNLYKVNESGDTLLRTGLLGDIYGFKIRESAAVTTVTKGTGTNYTSDTAGHAIGTTSIPIITGSGTVLAGDTVTFTGDTNKYVVKTGVSAPGTIVIQEPGLKVALAASAVDMTIGDTATQNVCFRSDAVAVVARPGLQPAGGGIEQVVISDPQTGLSFLVYRHVGDGIASWYMRVVYDAFCPNPYAIMQLLG